MPQALSSAHQSDPARPWPPLIEGAMAARAAIEAANARRAFAGEGLAQVASDVAELIEDVRRRGDQALLEACRRFDCATLEAKDLRVAPSEIEAAWRSLDGSARTALERASAGIEAYARAQMPVDFEFRSADGARLGGRYTPVESAGIYAPHGRAAYPSTVLMLAIPARVAGVERIALATPAGRDGAAHPVILAAARAAGIEEVHKLGGAVAVAALALGTPGVRRVDQIAGPGSIHFTLAKQQLFGEVGIDGLYGPSEVVIVADTGSDPAQIAADLLAQAEHGGDSWVCLLCVDHALCAAIEGELAGQLKDAPRAGLMSQSLAGSLLCHIEGMKDACELAGLCAAEHVEVWSPNARHWAGKIRHAGALFLNTPVPFGDYVIGPSHTLPTGTTARFASGVGVHTFLRRTSLVEAPKGARSALADALETLALLEDLPAHAAAARRSVQSP